MININRDMIATAARAELFAIPRADFDATLAAHDDATDFADTNMIELADDLDNAIMIFCPSTATDADIDDFADRFLAIMRDPTDADFIFAMMLDAITYRASLTS